MIGSFLSFWRAEDQVEQFEVHVMRIGFAPRFEQADTIKRLSKPSNERIVDGNSIAA
jgi:hypothetical protein